MSEIMTGGEGHDFEDARRITENLAIVRAGIAAACETSGRDVSSVQLLVATKTVPARRIRLAIDAGVDLIAENRVQELATKDDALAGLPVRRHFVGHLQSNKVRDVLRYVSCIHSVDSMSLASKLARELDRTGRQLDIFIQVNTSGEASKFGVGLEGAEGLIRGVSRMEPLRIVGLMTIGLLFSHGEAARRCFVELRRLRDRVASMALPGVEMTHLSMGMSPDYQEAIREGATIVRVGQAIFGPRPTRPGLFWYERDRPTAKFDPIGT